MAKMKGGCLCGKIRYEATGDPVLAGHCCCSDCRKATGAGHSTIAGFPSHDVDITGETSSYSNVGSSGGTVTRHFCGTCGSRLFSIVDAGAGLTIIQCGSLDDPSAITPQMVFYHKDNQAWDFLDPDLPKFDTVPPSVDS